MKTSTLCRSEIIQDLTEVAVRVLWKKSGNCTNEDLIEAGENEAAVSKFGSEAISTAKRIYNKSRAA